MYIHIYLYGPHSSQLEKLFWTFLHKDQVIQVWNYFRVGKCPFSFLSELSLLFYSTEDLQGNLIFLRSDPHSHVSTITPARKLCSHQINGHLSSDLINIIQTWFIIYCTWMSTRVRGCLMDICATATHYFQHVILNSAGVHSIFPEPQARGQGPASAGPPQWHGEIWMDLALSKLHFRQMETGPPLAANGLPFFPHWWNGESMTSWLRGQRLWIQWALMTVWEVSILWSVPETFGNEEDQFWLL